MVDFSLIKIYLNKCKIESKYVFCKFDPVFRTDPCDFFGSHTIVANLEKQLYFNKYSTTKLSLQSETIFTSPISMGFQNDYCLKLIEDIVILVHNLSKAANRTDFIVAVVTFAKLRHNGSFTQLLLNQWNTVMKSFLQSEDVSPFKDLRRIVDNYQVVKKLPVFKKLYRFLLYCTGTSLFKHLGVEFDVSRFCGVEKAAIKKDFCSRPDFIHCMLDTMLFLCETGHQCMVTGSMDPFLHSKDTYSKWLDDFECLKLQSENLSNPEPHGFTLFDFLSRLDSTIEQGEIIVNFQDKDSADRRFCRSMLNQLKSIRASTLTKKVAQQDRPAPFSVLISGGSSVAKSAFSNVLFRHYGALFDLPKGAEYRYVRNPFDKYWSNFNSSQWCVQLDDIAFIHPNAAQGCDPSLMEMLQVINNVPYVPTQADIADKGRTPLRARFVLATTNTEHLNAETYFSCPLAVQRRLPLVINIEPREEYQKFGCMLDASKVPKTSEGTYPDFWRITIKRVIPGKNKLHMGQTGKLETIQIFERISDFLLWFNNEAQTFTQLQNQAMASEACIENVVLCDCGLPQNMCRCEVELQSDSNYTTQTNWVTQVTQRHFREEEFDDADPRERLTMAWILRSIAGENIITRIVVFFYMSLLWVMDNYRWAPALMAFFFGNFYFCLVAFRVMHLPVCRRICFQLVGFRAYKKICRNKEVLVFLRILNCCYNYV